MSANPRDYWYTPENVLLQVQTFLGADYFDPCPVNPQFDGLTMRWHQRCFINPPYTPKLKKAFISKGLAESRRGFSFLWLVNFRNSVQLSRLHNLGTAVCIPHSRIKFIPGRPELGNGKSPRHDSIFILWGDPTGFANAFKNIGKCYIED